MKRVDLHIHTDAMSYEDQLEFSLDALKNYVTKNSLDIIAITNHNHFEKNQFEEIKLALNITVLAGVEVDIESSHLLVVVPDDRINELDAACSTLKSKILCQNDSISFEEFETIFPNYKDYILIPHYKKEPAIKPTTLEKFGNIITSGEVQSSKKFESTKKDVNSLVPVYFSDYRAEENNDIPFRYTYFEIDNCDFNVLKNSLRDKTKVYLSNSKKDDEFTILPNGTCGSTKLNVILGKRSSGKTYTLEQIKKTMQDGKKVKYIEQFSLTGSSEKDKYESLITADQQKFINDYLEPLRNITTDILSISKEETNKLDNYLTSLKSFAENQSLQDEYSKAKLFNEVEYDSIVSQKLSKSIEALIYLLDDEENRVIIEKYLDFNNLKLLLIELINKRKVELLDKKLKDTTDSIVTSIQSILNSKSAISGISTISFNQVCKENEMTKKYNLLISNLKNEQEIERKDLHRFKVVIDKFPFENTREIKKSLGISTTLSITDAFSLYANPYNYVKKLESLGVPEASIYKGIINIKVSVLNETGAELSGGERAEYNLIRELKDAQYYDLVLIDEPEASFDNLFIKQYIIDILKDLSQKTTIFITTHNNTLGVLMNPNKIIYTENDNGNYRVYTGEIGNKKLLTVDGKELESYNTILNVMEAGLDAYEERRGIYDSIKN